MVQKLTTIENVTRVGNLFSFYRLLLTTHQQDIVESYYLENFSLAEVAEHFDISRQAVHDNLRRAQTQMESYERCLGLLQRYREQQDVVENLLAVWEQAAAYVPADVVEKVEHWLGELSGAPDNDER